jgi:hypothetical protein
MRRIYGQDAGVHGGTAVQININLRREQPLDVVVESEPIKVESEVK